MFTGIIEELGKLAALDRAVGSATLTVDAPLVAGDLRLGSSVAVNGVCLTVTRVRGGQFTADVIGETLARTSLGALAPGSPVNLERPVRADGRLDGHLVQGHIDGTGTVTDRLQAERGGPGGRPPRPAERGGPGGRPPRPAQNWQVLRIQLAPNLQRYVVYKGSVAVDGVSLTVSAVDGSWFEVSLIPETLARTTLGLVGPGDEVNIEVDVLAKYVERLLGGSR